MQSQSKSGERSLCYYLASSSQHKQRSSQWVLDSYMKKIQKEYERKVKVSQHNDVFTTFQRSSHADHSSHIPKQHKALSAHHQQHQNIESLKTTLKSLVPASMDLTKPFSHSGIYLNDLKDESINDQYMLKLDNLTKNLQEIASKCYFSPGNADSTVRERVFSTKEAKSKAKYENTGTLSRYEPMNVESVLKYSNNASVELPSRNLSFMQKETLKSGGSHSRSRKKHDGSLKDIKNSRDDYDKSRDSSGKKKSFSKKEVVDMLQKPSNSKNLTKIFQSFDNNYPDLFKRRETSNHHHHYEVCFHQKTHRHKVTGILIAEQIFTSSLDYTIKKIEEEGGVYKSTLIQKLRGGVCDIASINSTIFSCGRDGYIRSLDGSYFYRCDSNPLAMSESDRPQLLNISFQNKQLRLFDLEKRIALSSIQFQGEFTPLPKYSKDIFVGANSALFGIDWRKRDYLVSLYRHSPTSSCNWLSDPYSNSFSFQTNGQLTILSPEFRKIKKKQLPESYQYVTYHWNRRGLYLLARKDRESYLMRDAQGSTWEEIDVERELSGVSRLIMSERQIIYGGKEGEVLVKSIKK